MWVAVAGSGCVRCKRVSDKLKGLKFSPYHLVSDTSRFDLAFDVFLFEGQLSVSIEYYTPIIDEEKVKMIAADFSQLVDRVLENENVAVGQALELAVSA